MVLAGAHGYSGSDPATLVRVLFRLRGFHRSMFLDLPRAHALRRACISARHEQNRLYRVASAVMVLFGALRIVKSVRI